MEENIENQEQTDEKVEQNAPLTETEGTTTETLDDENSDESIDGEEPAETENPENESTDDKAKSSFWSKLSSKEVQKLKTQLEEKETKYNELNDKFLRLYSEFDNYKKRTNREKLDLLATASENVLVALLPVVDDFERAIAANGKTEDLNAVKDGFNLIYNKLMGLLKRFDVTEIEAVGTEFNTDFHEAITNLPVDDDERRGKVIDVVEKGYKLKDKVIRYSKVVVAK